MVWAIVCEMVMSANQLFHSKFERARLLLIGADDEDGVVSGDGADDLGPVLVVDTGGDGLRAAGAGDEHEQVGSLADLEAEAREHIADAGQVVLLGDSGGWQGVAGGAFGELELMDVAGERRLCDVESTLRESAAQVVLVGNGGAGGSGLRQEFTDCVVALLFHLLLL